jgi:hypothetical protein
VLTNYGLPNTIPNATPAHSIQPAIKLRREVARVAFPLAEGSREFLPSTCGSLSWRLLLAVLVAFSHLQFSQIRGRRPNQNGEVEADRCRRVPRGALNCAARPNRE